MNNITDAGSSFGEGHGKDNKKHRTTRTQRESFKKLNASGHRKTQELKVYEFMTGKPAMTSRQLSTKTGYERSSINRIIRDLQDAGRVKVAYCAKCNTTGRTVEHYKAILSQPTLFDGMEGVA